MILGTWLRLLMFQGAGLAMAAATVALASLAVPPAVYGKYGLLLSIVQIASGVALSWVNQGLLRVGREEFARSGTSSNSLAAAIVLLATLGIALLATGWLMAPAMERAFGLPTSSMRLVAPCLIAFVAFETASYAAQANGRFDGYAGGQIISRAGPFTAILAMWLGLAGDAALLILAAGAGWALAAIYTGRAALEGGFKATPDWRREIGRIVRYGRWLPLASAAGLMSTWMGLWFIRGHVGLAEAGVLLWATGTYTLLAGMLQPLGTILAPGMIDLRLAGDRAEIAARIRLALAAALLVAIVMPAFLAVLKLVAGMVLPVNYQGAAPLLVVLLSVFPVLLITTVLSPLIGAFETALPRTVIVHVTAALLNLACLTALVPRIGTLAAPCASAVTIIATTAGLLIVERGIAGSTGSFVAVAIRYGLIALTPFGFALLLLALERTTGLVFGLASTAILLVTGRASGALRPLASARTQFLDLPAFVSPLALRLLDVICGKKALAPTGRGDDKTL